MSLFSPIALIVAFVVSFFLRRHRRKRNRTPWHSSVVFAGWFTYCVVERSRWIAPGVRLDVSWETICWIVFVVFLWLEAVVAFFEQRPQFSIRDLLILTLGVSLLFSARHYFGFRIVFPAVFVLYLLITGIFALFDARKLLLPMWEDPYDEVRIDVVHALGKMETPESLEMLKKMSHDSDRIVREEALRYLNLRTEKKEP